MLAFLWIVAVTALLLLLGALDCHLLPRMGQRGRAIAEWFARAPGLDLAITYFTMLPLILGAIAGTIWIGDGFFAVLAGLIAGTLGQIIAVMVWTVVHELSNREAARDPYRIVFVLNSKVGRWHNHAAVWSTALAVPLFWSIRLVQYLVYPLLVRLVHFPKYTEGDWVNLSRFRFQGLVGHDLIWCLYCDWMTGVWSLGSEMLRNVESFWCPIKFHWELKCEHCSTDFPDVKNTWIPADGTMKDVHELIDNQLAEKPFSWHGMPRPPQPTSDSAATANPQPPPADGPDTDPA